MSLGAALSRLTISFCLAYLPGGEGETKKAVPKTDTLATNTYETHESNVAAETNKNRHLSQDLSLYLSHTEVTG